MRDRERTTFGRAKALRSKMTDAEVILWSKLRGHQFGPYRFRRQHPIGPYIADFACVMHRLVVEVDGATHYSDAEIAYDRRRDAHLRCRGWTVYRVTNEDVYRHLDIVFEGIVRHMPPSRPSGGPPP